MKLWDQDGFYVKLLGKELSMVLPCQLPRVLVLCCSSLYWHYSSIFIAGCWVLSASSVHHSLSINQQIPKPTFHSIYTALKPLWVQQRRSMICFIIGCIQFVLGKIIKAWILSNLWSWLKLSARMSVTFIVHKNQGFVLCTCQSFRTSIPVYESVEEISKVIIDIWKNNNMKCISVLCASDIFWFYLSWYYEPVVPFTRICVHLFISSCRLLHSY